MAKKPPSKPPYRVPLMAEIRRTKPNGLKVASTFSGCGGSCLGFKMAGYTHVYASEFVPAARETYAANFPGVHVDDRDVRLVKPEEILKLARLKKGQLDVLEGSPPCASFSTAGKRSRDWGRVKKYSDTEQRTDDLFFEFVRLLRGLAPRAFVAENVSGLVKGVAKGYFLDILRELKGVGYRVECRVLDAQWLGVPQARQRTIFVGVREDLDRAPAFPKPLPYRYSISDAIGGIAGLSWHSSGKHGTKVYDVKREPLQTLTSGGDGANKDLRVIDAPTVRFRTGFRKGETLDNSEPAPTIMAGGIGGSSIGQLIGPVPGDAPSIERYAIGKEWKRLRPGQTSDKYFNLVRPDAPVPTVTQLGGANAGVAGVTHPSEPRKFSIAELRRLCGFPDDFVLTGSYSQQWERLGRAVPPPMMRAVAEALAGVLRA